MKEERSLRREKERTRVDGSIQAKKRGEVLQNSLVLSQDRKRKSRQLFVEQWLAKQREEAVVVQLREGCVGHGGILVRRGEEKSLGL